MKRKRSVALVPQETNIKEWWQHAVIYQIYPRTFKDSNGDGNGDIQGIISKLNHLKEINVDAIWLSPIYPSPQVDGGYDISDYKAIDPIYGTMADFEELVSKAKEMGMRIVMDLVPNHSSDQHEWFKKSVKNRRRYADYYVWKKGKGDDGKKPPTNWNSIFGGPAWTYNDERGEFYLHQFTKQQPDLNFENPNVVQEMKDIIIFWLDKGVSGFRIDAIRHLFEEYKDEPIANPEADPNSHEYFDHIYTTDQDKTYNMVYEWRQLVDEYTIKKGGESRLLMTEAYVNNKEVMRYYGEEGRLGAHFPFNFDLIDGLNKDTCAKDVVVLVRRWFIHMPVGFTPNWVLGNHDQHRVSTRLQSSERANMMNMLISILPGVMVTYNGEEIGMENGEVTYDEGRDSSGLTAGKAEFKEISRDFERTPFQWDDTLNAGFSECVKPWLPVSEKYKIINLAKQQEEKCSIYQNYKALTALRKKSVTLKEGTWQIYLVDSDGILLIRKYPGEKTVLFVCHMGRAGDVGFQVDLRKYGYESSTQTFDVISSTVTDKFGTKIEISNFTLSLEANEAYVLVESIV